MQDIPTRTLDEYRESRKARLDSMIASTASPAAIRRELSAMNRRLKAKADASRRRPRGRPIRGFGPDGGELGGWPSVVAASMATGVAPSTILLSICQNRAIRDGRRFVYAAHLATVPDARAA